MEQQQQELAKLTETIMATNTKIQALENRDHTGQMNASGEAKPYLKLFLPRFSGEDPQGWVYQAKQYFEFQKVAEGDRIALASFHLDGIALQWHRLEVKLKKPRRLVEAMGMARLVEKKNNLARKPFTPNRNVSNPGILGPAPTTSLGRDFLSCHLRNNTSSNPTVTRKDQNKDVVVLVDGGSTHNFVDQELVNRLGSQVYLTVNFSVVVGNQEKLACTGRVRNLSLIVQGCVISTDFFMLPVAACPIVLGVQCLKTLGPIEFDLNNLTMGFHIAGSHHKLQRLKASKLSVLKSHELMGICDALILQIVSFLPQVQPELSPSPAIQKVLTDFCKVFQELSGLPPPRLHTHSIPLLPGSKPMSSRPYRQPYFQKNEIEKQVRELMKPTGLLQPLPIPERVWEDISMDFIEGVAREFITNVVRLHGIPSTIVSDKDKTKVMNRILEQYLRCFVSDKPKKWIDWLPWAEYSYNTSVHTSTKFSLFEVVYGRLPPKLVPYIPGTTSVQEVDEYLQDRDSLLKHLRKNLLNAQDHMKENANRHRRDLEFKKGEFVLVKLQPYRQVSVANRLSVKLNPRYYGPYEVLARVGPIAYKIKLPPSSLVHVVFHVSFLRRFIGPLPAAVSELKEVPEPLEIPSDPQPKKILEERVITKGKYRPKTEVLIKWIGQPLGEATWENKWRFFKTYLAFHVEDNAGLSGVDCYVALDPTHAHRVSHTEGGIKSDASCQP
uniref:Tf2-1-like SH3-like domain-containing protein n=1 Tax=Tanacetum cinerariifolium TaxID=118510 RepID=A0A6L2LBQ3_TANCI|nr:hypothetical protein [Tanacetum cinerariifolium]